MALRDLGLVRTADGYVLTAPTDDPAARLSARYTIQLLSLQAGGRGSSLGTQLSNRTLRTNADIVGAVGISSVQVTRLLAANSAEQRPHFLQLNRVGTDQNGLAPDSTDLSLDCTAYAENVTTQITIPL